MAKKNQRQQKGSKVERLLNYIVPPLHEPAQPMWNALPWLLLVAFILRAAVALAGDFVIHPDEIMQYLEPAHGLVFGNAVSYWEYYYGARSWMVPSAVAAVLFVCKAIGLDNPAYYVDAVKLFFCALSLLIPLSLYIIGRRMFGENSGRIALVLAVFWYELVGFAHKPMTEFVATSLLMGVIVYAIRPQKLTAQQAIIASALAVLVVAVRFQYAPVAGMILLIPFIRASNQIRLMMVFASAAALLVVGLFEFITWGGFLHSYWLNFKVNLILNTYRGEESSAWNFIGWPIVASGGLFLLGLVSMLNYRRRLFLLLLSAAVVLPHMTQAHREYRFIFIIIPFWLLLFADLLAIGWEQHKKNIAKTLANRLRYLAGGVYAACISLAGIANVLPLQKWVYEANSQETGYVNFLRGQDEIFSIYRMLAADESVRGVQDITRPYFNGGGYYYLHRQVPFYSPNTTFYSAAEAKEHVSHIISHPLVVPAGIVSLGNRLVMQTEKEVAYPIPGYISDETLNKLVYWDNKGEATVVEGFTLSYSSDGATIWTNEEQLPLHTWQQYRVTPDSQAMHQVIELAGFDIQPADNFNIEFADE